MACSHQRAGDDASLAKELGVDANLQFRGTVLQTFQFLVVFLVAPLAMGTQVADSLADGPQQFVVGVALEAPLVGERQHLVVHARGITYS